MNSAYSLSLWACLLSLVKSQAPIAPPTLPGTELTSDNDMTPHLGRPTARTSAPASHPPNARVSGRYSEELITNRSIEVAKADFYCLDGFELNTVSQRCERKDDVKPEIGCPIGWQYLDGKCETTSVQPADRYCPDGFESVLGQCQRFQEAPKQLTCPPAYNHTEFGCVKDVETDPILECEKGLLTNGACVERVESTMTAICENGYELIDGDKCARRRSMPFREACPTRYTLRDGRCVLNEKITPGLECPPNSVLIDGRCKAEQTVAPFYQCADRRINSAEEQCPKEVTVEAIDVCPPGTTSVGDGCLLEEKIAPRHDCPEGQHMTPHGCSSGGHVSPTSKSCPSGFTMFDKATCLRKTVIPKERNCPPGFSLKGSVCAAIDYVAPTLTCPEGTTPNGKACLAREEFLPVPACPENTHFDALSKTCFGEKSVEPLHHCDIGTYEESENACILAEVLTPVLACPPGAKPSTSPHLGAICEENIIRTPQIACPTDFSLVEAEGPTCRGRAMADGVLSCMFPYEDAGDQCAYLESIPKIMGCTDGFLRGTACISQQTQAPLVLCADGYEYKKENELCSKTMWSKPIPICEDGFAYDNLVQRCFRLTEHGPGSSSSGGTDEVRRTTPGAGSGGPGTAGSNEPDSEAYKPQEAQLPLNVAPVSGVTPGTTTAKPVKVKVEQGSSGKEQFVPMTTFTGADALKQAETFETLKLANQVSGVPSQAVYTPPLTVH